MFVHVLSADGCIETGFVLDCAMCNLRSATCDALVGSCVEVLEFLLSWNVVEFVLYSVFWLVLLLTV